MAAPEKARTAGSVVTAMALALGLISGASHAAQAACLGAEVTVFACPLAKKAGHVALCAGGTVQQPAFPLTLRRTRAGKPPIVLTQTSRDAPASGANPTASSPFLYAQYTRYRVSRIELRAHRPASAGGDLAVYHYAEDDGGGLRVQAGVEMGGKTLDCRKTTRNRLARLESLLACDPDSALGINACPPGGK